MAIDLPQGRVQCLRTGQGEPLLMLHGFLQDHRVWQPLVDELSGDHSCWAPDLPTGAHPFGLRPDADLSLPGLARLVDDLLLALDLKDVTLIGNDTGGALAQVVATRHPERLSRLVLTGCEAFENFPPSPFRGLLLAARLNLLRPLVATLRLRSLRRLPSAFGLLSSQPLPHELIDAWLSAYRSDAGVRHDARKVLRALGEDELLLLRNTAGLAGFDRPTLIAWATDDRLFPYEHAQRLAAVIPQARLVPVEQSRTWVMRDQPHVLADVIRSFVRDT